MEINDSFKVYKEAVDVLNNCKVPYVVGGGIAVMAYGRRRVTKDIDLYIMPGDEMIALNALKNAGFDIDPMPEVHWLAKAFKNGLTIDFIIENVGGIKTTPETIKHGVYKKIGGYTFFTMSPEDLIIRKIMAMRSDRNDWYDCISVLSTTYETFNWEYFLKLVGYNYERALSFLLYVKTDKEHIIPIPRWVIKTLIQKI